MRSNVLRAACCVNSRTGEPANRRNGENLYRRLVQCVFPLLLLAAAWLVDAGCMKDRPYNPAATQPVTVVDPQLAEKEYWLAKPASDQVSYADFTTLWDTCEQVAHQYLFPIERRNFRAGILSTQPVISKQWFEWWRKDSATREDVEQNSIATIRRTIFFYFTQNLDGSYTVTPKIVVEKHSHIDPKYRNDDPDQPANYWYALRRDTVLEGKVAASIRERLAAGKS